MPGIVNHRQECSSLQFWHRADCGAQAQGGHSASQGAGRGVRCAAPGAADAADGATWQRQIGVPEGEIQEPSTAVNIVVTALLCTASTLWLVAIAPLRRATGAGRTAAAGAGPA
jgi:hypothetical protein